MTDNHPLTARERLREIAYRAMQARGLEPEFSPAALNEVHRITGPAASADPTVPDLRHLLWCSIDNDDSRDLDQLSVAEASADGQVRLRVAIADVSALVHRDSAIDLHARRNTTSVYTPAQIFPMLPERLSTDLTSLNAEVDRLAMVIDFVVDAQGAVGDAGVHPALVRNRAKLAYNSVGQWLAGQAPVPAGVAAVEGLEANLRLQVAAAQRTKALRHTHGALSLETVKARPVFTDGMLRDLEPETRDAAKELIEDLMIAANGVTARFLAAHGFPSIRRVVRTPRHWDRIVELAAAAGTVLPAEPDARALEGFLVAARARDPLTFPDVSLSVIKLMGPGEYAVESAGSVPTGHFGLAVKDYSHSTAPNRRYPDVLTQRLLKAALAQRPAPYTVAELQALAEHCTEQEDAAKKVERQLVKSAAAMLLAPRLGQAFDALVTGAADKGTWVRISAPIVEGRLVDGFQGRRVGERLRVQLVRTDVEHGMIDFRALRT